MPHEQLNGVIMNTETNESSLELQLINSMRSMTEYQQNKVLRLANRLVNKDAKAIGLIDKFDKGLISSAQLLSAI